MSQPFGCISIVLHGHIPYVLGHSTWPHGSNMVYEAAADTYIPLLWMLEELAAEGIPAGITLGMTPVTLEQLDDERFREWFPGFLESKRDAAETDRRDFSGRGDQHLAYLADRWRDRYAALLDSFVNRYQRDLPGQFRAHQDAGHLEIMCSAATHGYLPLLHEDGSIRGQIREGVATYERLLGRRPRGFWLPECAYRPRCNWAPPPHIRIETPWYRPGLEELLGNEGYDYFIADSHMIERGQPLPVSINYDDNLGKTWSRITRAGDYTDPKTIYRPYFVGDQFEDHPPVAAFFRDPQTSLKVWSGKVGYPGDFNYLDFHKKHIPGDHRYWRVTDSAGDLGGKQPYEPQWAEDHVREHAGNFLWTVKETLRHAPHYGDKLPVVLSPFDAELFGHWWHEGPRWLAQVLRWMHHDPEVRVTTCSEYLHAFEPQAALSLPEGSWGAGGGHWVWLNERTDWTWPRVYDAEEDLQALLRDHGTGHDDAQKTLVQQACRELLLLQASDWQFLITTGGAADYAAERLGSHHSDYKKVADMARRYGRGQWIGEDEWQWFGDLTSRNRLFAGLQPEHFR
jgi:1,4-alpha-glucan branching enzyme